MGTDLPRLESAHFTSENCPWQTSYPSGNMEPRRFKEALDVP